MGVSSDTGTNLKVGAPVRREVPDKKIFGRALHFL